METQTTIQTPIWGVFNTASSEIVAEAKSYADALTVKNIFNSIKVERHVIREVA